MSQQRASKGGEVGTNGGNAMQDARRIYANATFCKEVGSKPDVVGKWTQDGNEWSLVYQMEPEAPQETFVIVFYAGSAFPFRFYFK